MLFYIDDIQFFVYLNSEKTYETWPSNLAEHIIVNLRVGGDPVNGKDDTIVVSDAFFLMLCFKNFLLFLFQGT
jgi:hypothetical protein